MRRRRRRGCGNLHTELRKQSTHRTRRASKVNHLVLESARAKPLQHLVRADGERPSLVVRVLDVALGFQRLDVLPNRVGTLEVESVLQVSIRRRVPIALDELLDGEEHSILRGGHVYFSGQGGRPSLMM